MQKLESSKPAGGNGKWCCHYGKQFGLAVLQKKLPLGLPYDPPILLLGKYLKELKTGTWILYPSVQWCIIHNSQQVETTQEYPSTDTEI